MKKLLFLLLACALLCGCSEREQEPSRTTTTNSTTTTTANTTTSTTTTTPQTTTTTPEATTAPIEAGAPIDSEKYSEQISIAKDVNGKAGEIYGMFFSDGFDDKVEFEAVDPSENETLGLDKDATYLRVTDERYDTWDELTEAISEGFSENGAEFMSELSPVDFYEVDGKTYAKAADGGPMPMDYVQAESATDIENDKFTITYGAYMLDEQNKENIANRTEFSCTYVKIDDNWVIDDCSENKSGEKDLRQLFIAFEVRY